MYYTSINSQEKTRNRLSLFYVFFLNKFNFLNIFSARSSAEPKRLLM